MRVEHFIERPQMRRRIAVAGEAPAHIECRRLPGQRHVADRAVAFRAADAFGDMDAVIEIDVVGETIDPGPAQRFPVSQALTYRREDRRIGPNLGMAGHAGFSRRNAGVLRRLNRRMAIAAVEPEAADMMLVAERDGLYRRVPLQGV